MKTASLYQRLKNLKPIHIKTAPFPGFATDLQQPITPLLTLAEGEKDYFRDDLSRTYASHSRASKAWCRD